MTRSRLVASGVVFALCCVADAFVLRTGWTGSAIAPGQFRRGYFERVGTERGLVFDMAIRPDMLPSFLLDDGGALAVPPGMTAVAPLAAGMDYTLVSQSALAPYIAIGSETAAEPAAPNRAVPGEGRLRAARTLAIQGGRLTLVNWDLTLPWRNDAARLAALRDACAQPGATLSLQAHAGADRLELRLGRCDLNEPLPPLAQLAAVAGPDWLTVAREPAWKAQRWIVWPLLGVIVAKVAALWWGLGAISAVAASVVLAAAALLMPVPAMLTWPLMLIIGIAAAGVRAGVTLFRRMSPWGRAVTGLATMVAVAVAVALNVASPVPPPDVVRSYWDHSQPTSCAVLGYSTVKGEGLRGQIGGIRSFLDEDCAECRHRTGGIFAGGEMLSWLRDSYCSSPASFGADGHVYFLGGANDDYLWAVLSMARMFIVGQQGITPWRRNELAAAAGSRARIDAQTATIAELMQCARARGADVVFLHDFLATDLLSGRGEDRAAMLMRRREAVEGAGGSFVDLLSAFGDEVGVCWFNDYVHLSLIAHERVAELACRLSSTRRPQSDTPTKEAPPSPS